jgi:hypothetical protein
VPETPGLRKAPRTLERRMPKVGRHDGIAGIAPNIKANRDVAQLGSAQRSGR